jgi:hypothetical protein
MLAEFLLLPGARATYQTLTDLNLSGNRLGDANVELLLQALCGRGAAAAAAATAAANAAGATTALAATGGAGGGGKGGGGDGGSGSGAGGGSGGGSFFDKSAFLQQLNEYYATPPPPSANPAGSDGPCGKGAGVGGGVDSGGGGGGSGCGCGGVSSADVRSFSERYSLREPSEYERRATARKAPDCDFYTHKLADGVSQMDTQQGGREGQLLARYDRAVLETHGFGVGLPLDGAGGGGARLPGSPVQMPAPKPAPTPPAGGTASPQNGGKASPRKKAPRICALAHLNLNDNCINGACFTLAKMLTRKSDGGGGKGGGDDCVVLAQLTTLRLRWNGIRGPAALALATAVGRNKSLELLDLAFNTFGCAPPGNEAPDPATDPAAAAAVPAAPRPDVALAMALVRNPSLTELDLSENQVKERGAMLLLLTLPNGSVPAL